MEGVEHEICNNCKKEIPQHNYVMHSMHCSRNITLCKVCKEPIPKSQFSDHERTCKPKPEKKPTPPPTIIERSSYYQTRKAVEDKKTEARKERYMQRMDRLVDPGYSFRNGNTNSYSSPRYSAQSSLDRTSTSRFSDYNFPVQNGLSNSVSRERVRVESPPRVQPLPPRMQPPPPPPQRVQPPPSPPVSVQPAPVSPPSTGATKRPEPSKGMLECKYCDLELPKLDLEEHENYCGSRTDKCLECGELVMYRDKQSHMDSNHPHLKKRGRNPAPAWDSAAQRTEAPINDLPTRRRPAPFTPFAFDYDPMPYLPTNYQAPTGAKKKDGENYKDISRRLDCKTEYIRNLLHDSASITIPLRRTATAPRNHFNHDKGPAPQPPSYRRRNPPTELVIPCEFCGVPVPHEDLIQHETGCRPDLARFNPRRRVLTPEPEDDYGMAAAPVPQSPEVELPCEFCGDMIPASQLLGHQIRCT